MNLYMVRSTGWGLEYALVEAASEEDAVTVAGIGTPLYPPEVERIDLQSAPGIRWSYEHSPDTPSE
jgi:hypothetical protein